MILGSGNYLKTSDVVEGDKVEFIGSGEWIESKRYTYPDGNPRNDFYIKVKIADSEKNMRMNATNREAMIQAFGKDTDNWVGKSATLHKIKAMVAGKLQDCLTIEPNLADQGEAQPETDVPF
jgi:hypothetical protein